MSSANCGGGGGSGVGALVPTHRRGGFGRRCQDTANSLPGGQPVHGGPLLSTEPARELGVASLGQRQDASSFSSFSGGPQASYDLEPSSSQQPVAQKVQASSRAGPNSAELQGSLCLGRSRRLLTRRRNSWTCGCGCENPMST